MATVAELNTKLSGFSEELAALWDKSDENDGQLSDDDRTKVSDLNKSIDETERLIKDVQSRAKNVERLEHLNGKSGGQAFRFPSTNGTGKQEMSQEERLRKAGLFSPGDVFAQDQQFLDWYKSMAPNGQIPGRARIQSPPVEVKGLLTSVTMRPLISTDDIGLQAYTGWPPLPIFSVITNGTTTSDTIEFARITGYENNAAPVPEATDVTGTSGTKPMSNMTVEPDSTTVKTIAHWIPATKRVLSDVAQLRTIIDAFLREGLRQQLAWQIINGPGTGENFLGILNTPGLQGPIAAGADPIAAIRRARTLAAIIGRVTPNAILMNPANWEAVDLLQYTGTGQYIFGGPMSMGTPRLWGLPVIEDEAMPFGTAIVGDFRMATLWNREQATISATDSHADFFIRNLVAILGELRAAFALMQPSALVVVTGLPGTALPAPAEPPPDSGTRTVSSAPTSGGGTAPRTSK